jgi:hypothetical protein
MANQDSNWRSKVRRQIFPEPEGKPKFDISKERRFDESCPRRSGISDVPRGGEVAVIVSTSLGSDFWDEKGDPILPIQYQEEKEENQLLEEFKRLWKKYTGLKSVECSFKNAQKFYQVYTRKIAKMDETYISPSTIEFFRKLSWNFACLQAKKEISGDTRISFIEMDEDDIITETRSDTLQEMGGGRSIRQETSSDNWMNDAISFRKILKVLSNKHSRGAENLGEEIRTFINRPDQIQYERPTERKMMRQIHDYSPPAPKIEKEEMPAWLKKKREMEKLVLTEENFPALGSKKN